MKAILWPIHEEADVQQVLLDEIISRTLKTLARDKLRKLRATSTADTILDKLWVAQRDSHDFWFKEVSLWCYVSMASRPCY